MARPENTHREDREITLVRNAAPPTPPLSEAGRHAVRVRLRQAALRRRRRRLVLGVALPAGAALAVVAVLVASFVVVPSVKDDAPPASRGRFVPPTADSAALLRAADEVRAAEKRGTGLPIPRADQYEYTRDVLWEIRRSDGRRLVFPNESWRSVDGTKKSLIGERHNVTVAPARKQPIRTEPASQYAGLRELPADPERLIDYVYRVVGMRDGHGGSVKTPPLTRMTARDLDDICMFMTNLLRHLGATPPGLRPAALEVLARVPGIRVNTKATDILGRPGVSIAWKSRIMGDYRPIFDRRTYAYLGFSQAHMTRSGAKTNIIHKYALVEWGVTDHYRRRPDRLIKP